MAKTVKKRKRSKVVQKRKNPNTLKILGWVFIGIGIIVVVTYLFLNMDGKESPITKSKKKRDVNVEQCYQNLCAEKITIEQNKDSGNIQFVLKNTGEETVTEGILEIVFEDGEKRSFYYPTLEKDKSVEVKITYEGEALKNVEDYSFRERVKEEGEEE